MKTLEVIRHTMRQKPKAHIMQEGVELATNVAQSMNKFDLVVTSEKIRAFETAQAMGYEVHQKIADLGIMPEQVKSEISWPNKFLNIAIIIKEKEKSRKFAEKQLSLWLNIAKQIPQNGKGLIISHGGIIELGGIMASPETNFCEWGGAIGYCEGIKLFYDNGIFLKAELLRLPDELRIIDNA